METKKHPAWKNAIEIILERFDKEGYGIMFSHNEVDMFLDLKKPDYSVEKYEKYRLDRLGQIENLKTFLLEECNLCFENSQGNGYCILHPNDQIAKAATKYHKHARRKINRMVAVLTNVDNESLSIESKQRQIDMLGKAAFIKAAMNKRKILSSPDFKQIV